jgi:hypothetical protein
MKTFILAFILLSASAVAAQEPTGRYGNPLISVVDGVLVETGSTAKDLITFKRPAMTWLTIAQMAAAAGDGQVSLNNLHRNPHMEDTGIVRLLVGRRPDLHKYFLAGILEVGVTAVTAHYLRTHGPVDKWYWKYVWIVPQTVSISFHVHSMAVGIKKP